MAPKNIATFSRICGFCFALALIVAAVPAWGTELPSDLRFSSYDCLAADDASVSDCCPCESCMTSSAPCCHGCCGCDSLSDELTRRLTGMAKRMQTQGITYAPGVTQFYQGVTSGGGEQEFEYGGKVDQFLILDSGKLGLWDGMTMTLHAETRFGQDVNNLAVGLAPINVAMLYPKLGEHETAITGLSFAQNVSDDVQVTFGKFNALDLFYGLYPQTGRGVDGFMNTSMVLPLAVGRVVPLSFMGAGVIKLHEKQMQGGVLVYDTQNCTTTSGFDDLFDNGANILGFWRFFTNFGGLPGSQFVGGIWSTGKFTAYDPAGFVIVPGEGVVVPREHGAYTLLYICEQTLWQDCCNKKRNVGLLSQWGLADERTSPFSWTANVAVQATGLSGCRPEDACGIGYFHTGLSSDFRDLLSNRLDLHNLDGVELYYTAAINKFVNLTADLQVIEPANVANDTAVVFGLRASVGM